MKCKCGNKYEDNFTWEEANEYKCRDCGAVIRAADYIEFQDEVAATIFEDIEIIIEE